MEIFPAIDLIGGKVVRLSEGDYSREKKYAVSALQAAQSFFEAGARCLHVVDLDGAKSGRAENAETIESIVKSRDMFVEVGGGIRTFDQIERYLDCGVRRVILGTVAVRDFSFVERAVQKFGSAISVGVDAKDGKVAISGWKEVTDINSLEFCKRLKEIGVQHVIYTDISKDGMMKGTNLEVYRVLCQTEYPKITASGGITFVDEVKKLKEMGVYGAILGKALYEGKISLAEAVQVAKD